MNQRYLNRLWDAHYRIEDDELRVMIAGAVIDELTAAGWTRAHLTAKHYIHPMIRRKDMFTRRNILDILADFIVKTRQATENTVDYPVRNAEAEWDENRRWRTWLKAVQYEGVAEMHTNVDGRTYGLERSGRTRAVAVETKEIS